MPRPPPTPKTAESRPIPTLTFSGGNSSRMIAKLSGKSAPPAPETTRKAISDQMFHANAAAEAAGEEEPEADEQHPLLAELVAELAENGVVTAAETRNPVSTHVVHAVLAPNSSWNVRSAGKTIVCCSANAVPASVRIAEGDVVVLAVRVEVLGTDERLVLDPVRLERLGAARLLDPVRVLAPAALEPRHLAVALEGEDVRRDRGRGTSDRGVITTAQPAKSSSASSSARSVSTSRSFVGSSSSSTLPPLRSSFARWTRFRSPPERSLDALLLVAASEVEPARRTGASSPRCLPSSIDVLVAGDLLPDRVLRVEVGARLVDVGELRPCRRSGARRASGCSSPAIIRKSVVLPAPFGPITPTIPPGGSEKVMSSTSRRSPKPFATSVGLDDDVAEPRAGRDVDLDPVELHVLLLGEQLLVGGRGAPSTSRAARAGSCAPTRARARACGRRADSVFSSTASRACFCSSHDE